MKNIFLGITVVIFLLCGNAFAQTTTQTKTEKAIIAVVTSAGTAWESGNMSKFAETLTENCVHIDPFGKQISGRENIRQTLQWVRDVVYKKAKMELKVSEPTMTFINTVTAIMTMQMTSTMDGKSIGNPIRMTFVVAKVKNDWKIASFQSIDLTEPPMVKPN